MLSRLAVGLGHNNKHRTLVQRSLHAVPCSATCFLLLQNLDARVVICRDAKRSGIGMNYLVKATTLLWLRPPHSPFRVVFGLGWCLYSNRVQWLELGRLSYLRCVGCHLEGQGPRDAKSSSSSREPEVGDILEMKTRKMQVMSSSLVSNLSMAT